MYILPFASTDIRLETAGGKGANLARLTRAGFQVPGGFIISTDAYRAFVESNTRSFAADPSPCSTRRSESAPAPLTLPHPETEGRRSICQTSRASQE